MNFRDNVFLAVAENLSFSKASKELFISQPAVTKHIKELENSLNISLFERKNNRVYLTEAGKRTYTYLKKIKAIYEELDFELGKLKDAFKGTLRIGASSTISQYLLPSVLAAFNKRYPEIELFLFNGNSFEMQQKLINNQIDIVFVENFSSHPDIKYIDFLDDEILIVTGAKSVYSKKRFLTIADFYEVPIVLREKGSGTLEVIQQSLAKNNLKLEKLNIFIHLGSTEAIKNFLEDFNGIALVSEKSIIKEIQLKTLKILKVKNLSIHRKFRIGQLYGNEKKMARLFLNFLKDYNF